MNPRLLFAGIGVLAALAGTALWLGSASPSRLAASTIAPEALFATSFRDLRSAPQSLGQFQGRILVINFWATWCAPCREEMPAFNRVQSRWAGRNVQFVGLASQDAAQVERFAHELAIGYPLWTGGEEVYELSRRLGNRQSVLPHTVILDGRGAILEQRVGPYTEAMLEERLQAFSLLPPASSRISAENKGNGMM